MGLSIFQMLIHPSISYFLLSCFLQFSVTLSMFLLGLSHAYSLILLTHNTRVSLLSFSLQELVTKSFESHPTLLEREEPSDNVVFCLKKKRQEGHGWNVLIVDLHSEAELGMINNIIY